MADRRFTTLHIGGKGESVQDYGVLEAQAQQRIDQQQLAQQQANQQASARLALDRDRAAMAQSQFVQNLRQRQAEQEAMASQFDRKQEGISARSQAGRALQRDLATQNQAAQMDRLRESLGLQREMGDRKYGEMEASRLQRGALAHLRDETTRRGQDFTWNTSQNQIDLGRDKIKATKSEGALNRTQRDTISKREETARAGRAKVDAERWKARTKGIEAENFERKNRFYYGMVSRGMVQNKYGKWVKDNKSESLGDRLKRAKLKSVKGGNIDRVQKSFKNLKIDFGGILGKDDEEKVADWLEENTQKYGRGITLKALQGVLNTGSKKHKRFLGSQYANLSGFKDSPMKRDLAKYQEDRNPVSLLGGEAASLGRLLTPGMDNPISRVTKSYETLDNLSALADPMGYAVRALTQGNNALGKMWAGAEPQ